MVTIKASYTKMLKTLGKNLSIEELDRLLSFAKSEIDEYVEEEDMLVIDVKTSNRPDLWIPEGMIREIKGIWGEEKGIPKLELKESDYKVIVDPKLSKSRPFIACAIAKNVTLTDYNIKQLMQLSEKIDHSYGRRRKRSSIGMYNLSMIKSPIQYKVIDKNHKFIPLGYTEPQDLETILETHEKGKEFGYIVKSYGHYPILLSADGLTLSMPPIINSNDVGRVTEETTDMLIEVTGTHLCTVHVVLNILCQTLADLGAELYNVTIEYPKEILDKTIVTPTIEYEEIEINLKEINKYLGTKLKPKKVEEVLNKRRFDVKKIDKDMITVLIPPYRTDILHWVDIAEEIAIGLDYNKMGPTKWKVLTTGGLLPETESENIVRDILVGTGAIEVITNTLTDPDILTIKVNIEEDNFVKISNPVSKNYSVIRNSIFPNLINILSKNTHETYPQVIFEVGEIVKLDKGRTWTQTNAAYMLADTETSFEDAHKVLDQMMRLLETNYNLIETEHPSFIRGRSAEIEIEGKICGIIGEVNPEVLEKNQIWMPTVGFEIELPLIPSLECKKKYTY
ncbi:MAG: phenylalanine--tRNA ligase subunit beta [Candidatus Heimdallarchaeum endolithica]|uniref:Phenylalanine--tRNA ligase beta subunit n=1 Tax=Candidatus Heimdallarchaeum endolithica TaxID=2876572 RepID=A0A9Y1FQW3_9ARCH|nr:MAG: phenylalanine--tRNA ligase subunit beta [Candidatus Heimdallarchaeum endolithica]